MFECTIATPSARCALPLRPLTCRRVGHGPAVGARRVQLVTRMSATQEGSTEVVDENVLEYCSLDKQGKKPTTAKTLGEKEQEFIQALTDFYYNEKPSLSNEEFDLLKEELIWEGSKVAVLSADEKRFLEAMLAYNAGKPILSDAEFDKLKGKLKQDGSFVASQGPRCSIRSQKMYSDLAVDYYKMVALNLPAAVAVLLGLFAVDDLAGFKITQVMELPAPWGIIIVWGLILPTVYVFADAITNLLFKDHLILKGPCPNCNTEVSSYFGDILTVPGNRDANTFSCPNCKAQLTMNANKRELVVDSLPEA